MSPRAWALSRCRLRNLSRYRQDAIAEYVLCVSTNTPTQRVNYAQGNEGLYFGDAAGAVVVSAHHSGLLKLLDVDSSTDLDAVSHLSCDLMSHIERSTAFDNFLVDASCEAVSRVQEALQQDSSLVIPSSFSESVYAAIAEKTGTE